MPSSLENKIKSRIHVLPDALANQIAAGEVVERPASVVKELVENAIDAGSTRIDIEIEAAGRDLIRVSDNGEGMQPADAKLAFQRHATSKLQSSEDLAAIKTLGFRGEALPSIASIACVRLSTACDENAAGTEVTVEGGILKDVKVVARPRGTAVLVERIFFNTPARKKFMKGSATEFSHIAQVVTQQALAHPHIQFALTHNGRQIFNTLPTQQLLYRIAELFGAELAKELVRVEEGDGRYRMEGYISNPVFTRSNRSTQYCFVNNRFIRDKVILHATQQGYSHLLPRGQHPVLFLSLFMDPGLVDVNVHPAKAEVRFAFQQEVHHFMSAGVKNALARNDRGEFGDYARPSGQSIDIAYMKSEPRLPAPSSSSPSQGGHKPFAKTFPQQQNRPDSTPQTLDLFYHRPEQARPESGGETQPVRHSRPGHHFQAYDGKLIPVAGISYGDFEPLGQLNNSFIILQGKKGVVIVDQHIAHERILYERFRDAMKNRNLEVQQLLFPLAVEFSPSEAELLLSQMERLKELGLELEPFGDHGFLLRSVPAMLKNDDHSDMLREIVDELRNHGKADAVQEKYEEIVIMMACRNAIKVNHPLDMDQIRKLLFDLERAEMPYTCPHGRPISLLMDIEDILKKFLRK